MTSRKDRLSKNPPISLSTDASTNLSNSRPKDQAPVDTRIPVTPVNKQTRSKSQFNQSTRILDPDSEMPSGSLYSQDVSVTQEPSSPMYMHTNLEQEREDLREWNKSPPKALWKPLQLPLLDEDISAAEAQVRLPWVPFLERFKKYGILALVDRAYQEAQDTKHPFMGSQSLSSPYAWRKYGVNLLASMPSVILHSFLGDGITHGMKSGPYSTRLKSIFNDKSDWQQRSLQVFAPCIYTRELVDKHGNAPTPADLRKVARALQGYVSGDRAHRRMNVQIDCATRDSTDEDLIESGYHYFLQGNKCRAEKIITFCHALQQRLDKIPDENKSIRPLTYVGYAREARERFKDYSEDRNQSWLTELLRDTCKAVLKKDFMLESYVICYLTSHNECKIGEALLSILGEAYAESGAGLGVVPGDISVTSSNTDSMTVKQAEDQWKLAKKFRNRGDLIKNLEATKELLPAYKKFMDEMEAKYEAKQNEDAKKKAKRKAKQEAKQEAKRLKDEETNKKLRSQHEQLISTEEEIKRLFPEDEWMHEHNVKVRKRFEERFRDRLGDRLADEENLPDRQD